MCCARLSRKRAAFRRRERQLETTMLFRHKVFRNENVPPSAGNWQAPPELLRAPREVCLSPWGKAAAAAAVILALGAIVGGPLLYVAATRDQARNRKYEQEGIGTQARVTRNTLRSGKNARRVIDYAYAVDGREFTGQASLPQRQARNLTPGSTLAVLYLGNQPQMSWVSGNLSGVPIWTAALFPGMAAIGCFVIGFSISRQRRLLSIGRVAQATITHIRRIYAHNHRGYRVSYEFKTLSGAPRAGKYESPRQPYPVGSVLTVVYDADEPKRSAPYPFSLVRVSPR